METHLMLRVERSGSSPRGRTVSEAPAQSRLQPGGRNAAGLLTLLSGRKTDGGLARFRTSRLLIFLMRLRMSGLYFRRIWNHAKKRTQSRWECWNGPQTNRRTSVEYWKLLHLILCPKEVEQAPHTLMSSLLDKLSKRAFRPSGLLLMQPACFSVGGH